MIFRRNRLRVLILFPLASLILTSCSSSETAEPAQPTELRETDAPTVDTPEAQLFHEAKRLYRAGLYSVAVDSFESLRVNYPLSTYVEFAEIKIADARFESRDFGAASAAYEEFVKSHPASSTTPYAILMAGRSFQLTNRGVGRDIASLERAKEFYARLIEQHPSSFYARQARNYLREVSAAIADHEKFIMEFYRRKSNARAVEARSKVYEQKLIPAVAKLDEENAALKTVRASVEGEHVKSHAPALLAAIRSDGATGKAASRQIGASVPTRTSEQELARLDVQRVQCRANRIFLFLREPIPVAVKELRPQNGLVTLDLQGASSRSGNFDCFGKGDLTVSESGVLSFNSDKNWEILSVNNPPRLVIVEK